MGGFGYCETNLCATIDRNKVGGELDLFLALWNRERDCLTITRDIQS
jgi:hypothetical protein